MKPVALFTLTALLLGCRTVTPEERAQREAAAKFHREQRQAAKLAALALDERRRNTLDGRMVKHHPWTTGLSNVTCAIYYNRSRNYDGTPESRPLGAYLSTLLAKQGWNVTHPTNAEYIVAVDWQRDNESFSEQHTVPQRGIVGGGTSYESGTVWTPNGPRSYSGTVSRPWSFGITGYKTETKRSTVFTWDLVAQVYRTSDWNYIFKGQVRCVSTSYREEAPVIAGLLDAMFESFPGRDPGVEGDAYIYPHSIPMDTAAPKP